MIRSICCEDIPVVIALKVVSNRSSRMEHEEAPINGIPMIRTGKANSRQFMDLFRK